MRHGIIQLALFAASLALSGPAPGQPAGASSTLPRGFVYLRDIAPSIQQEIRYAGANNFAARRIAGYDAAECILTRDAAGALAKVQRRLPDGLTLKVYDCYRPRRAVADFVAWAQDAADQKAKAEYYPTVDKTQVFELGYIARRSGHSRGSTVDITIADKSKPLEPPSAAGPAGACIAAKAERRYDNSLDFGTGYDCFHELSSTADKRITGEPRRNRDLLVTAMRGAGFVNYRREWWHFTLADEPFDEGFDFPIRARSN